MAARFMALMALAAGLLAGFGCAHVVNYLDPRGPGCALSASEQPAADPGRDSFEVVSFNVKYGKDPEKALRTLQQTGWGGADVYVLQEVDWRSTVVIAQGLA